MELGQIGAILGGFVVLVWGAERFVMGASVTARNLGVSPLIIGLIIVGFGTSAPELLVSALAAMQGNTGLAIGNAIGSNIANVGLVLGAAAVVAPLSVHSDTVRRELPTLLAIMAFALVLMLDGNLTRFDGAALLVALGALMAWMFVLARRSSQSDPLQAEFAQEIPGLSLGRALLWLAVGLGALMLGARMVVWGAVGVAQFFGVSDLIIGLTVVAIGTSLPELAASIMSAVKGEHDIAIGNVIGSNMFNLLGVMGIPAVIHPDVFDHAVLTRDFPVMVALTLALFVMAYGFKGRGKVNRIEGAGLLTAFFGYLGVLVYASS